MTTFNCVVCKKEKHYSEGLVLNIKVEEFGFLEFFICGDCITKRYGQY